MDGTAGRTKNSQFRFRRRVVWLVVAACGALAAGFLLSLARLATPADAQIPVDVSAAIAFADVVTGGASGAEEQELFLVQPDGTLRIQLTASDGTDESEPSWSPRRDELAYSANLPPDPIQGDDLLGIHAIDLATRVTRTLSPGPFDFAPDWHPGGALVSFVSAFALGTDSQASAVSVVEPTGDNPRPLIQLADPRYLIDGPAWSPDGSMIAFTVVGVDDGGRLFVMNEDGSGARLLLELPGYDAVEPAWSPDGLHLAFASGPFSGAGDDHHEIAVIDLETGLLGSVASDASSDLRRPSWSPDGAELVYEALPAGPGEPSQLYAVSWLDRNVRGPITRGSDPDWMGAGALTPTPPTSATPTISPTAGSPTATSEATSTIPPEPSLPPPATLPPFPTFPPSRPPGTAGPLPTYPPPTATASATATGGPTVSPTLSVAGRTYIPYASNRHELGGGAGLALR